MKRIIPVLVMLITLNLSLTARQTNDTLYQLYKAKQYPSLKKANTDSTHPLYYFYKAAYANACNRTEESAEWLRKYLGKKKKPEASIAFEYYTLEHDNHVRNFDFKKAAVTGPAILKKFRKKMEPDEIRGNENAALIWKALRNEPRQRVMQPSIDTLPFTRDVAGLINLEVRSGGSALKFVFDTGAGLSCVTESVAEQMGFRILPDSGMKVAGFNNIYNPVRIAIADSIRMGDLIVYNEPFLVFKDEAFSFANGLYRIQGIIGFPITKELGRITIEPKQLVLQKHEADDPTLEQNFFVETLRPLVILNYKGRPMPFNFDTGANSSDFFKPFYEADSTALLAVAKLVERQAGSAGGVSNHKVLEVPALEFVLNGQTISIPNAGIDPERLHVSDEKLFGNIGQDLLKQYKKVTIDFGNSHLRLSN